MGEKFNVAFMIVPFTMGLVLIVFGFALLLRYPYKKQMGYMLRSVSLLGYLCFCVGILLLPFDILLSPHIAFFKSFSEIVWKVMYYAVCFNSWVLCRFGKKILPGGEETLWKRIKGGIKRNLIFIGSMLGIGVTTCVTLVSLGLITAEKVFGVAFTLLNIYGMVQMTLLIGYAAARFPKTFFRRRSRTRNLLRAYAAVALTEHRFGRAKGRFQELLTEQQHMLRFTLTGSPMARRAARIRAINPRVAIDSNAVPAWVMEGRECPYAEGAFFTDNDTELTRNLFTLGALQARAVAEPGARDIEELRTAESAVLEGIGARPGLEPTISAGHASSTAPSEASSEGPSDRDVRHKRGRARRRTPARPTSRGSDRTARKHSSSKHKRTASKPRSRKHDKPRAPTVVSSAPSAPQRHRSKPIPSLAPVHKRLPEVHEYSEYEFSPADRDKSSRTPALIDPPPLSASERGTGEVSDAMTRRATKRIGRIEAAAGADNKFEAKLARYLAKVNMELNLQGEALKKARQKMKDAQKKAFIEELRFGARNRKRLRRKLRRVLPDKAPRFSRAEYTKFRGNIRGSSSCGASCAGSCGYCFYNGPISFLAVVLGAVAFLLSFVLIWSETFVFLPDFDMGAPFAILLAAADRSPNRSLLYPLAVLAPIVFVFFFVVFGIANMRFFHKFDLVPHATSYTSYFFLSTLLGRLTVPLCWNIISQLRLDVYTEKVDADGNTYKEGTIGFSLAMDAYEFGTDVGEYFLQYFPIAMALVFILSFTGVVDRIVRRCKGPRADDSSMSTADLAREGRALLHANDE